jgi:transcriptional regulator with XRE-family HTH domain
MKVSEPALPEPLRHGINHHMAQATQTFSQEHIIMRIREELAQRRMARAQLADLAKVSLSSLEKSLAGQRPITEQTILRIEQVLGLRFPREADKQQQDVAAEHLGSYTRPAVAGIEGCYLTLRPAPQDSDALVAYETYIFWDITTSCLRFREHGRADSAYTQQGEVAFPHQSGHIYLITNAHGQQRLMMLSRRAIDGALHGLMLTLQPLRGGRLQPVSMPIAMLPMADEFEKLRGLVKPEAQEYARLKAVLDSVLQEGFAAVLG